MAKEKKQVSFSDFIVDEDTFTPEVESADEEVDEVEDKVEKKEKKTVKKQSKQEDEPSDEDSADPDQSDDEVVETKSKVKKQKSSPPPADEPEEGEEQEEVSLDEAKQFFEEVEKITGSSVDVDYGETNPLSPQGIAIRDKAIKEATLDSFLEEIEAKFPTAFKALQHAYNGGNVADLFSQTTGRDYSKIELKEGDDQLAKEILKEYYKANGVKNESKINRLIEADEDSEEGLLKEAQNALTSLKEKQEEETSKILEEQKTKASEQKKKDQIIVAAIDEVIESKKLGSFKIIDRTDAVEFKKFVLNNLRRGENGYELAMQVNPNELEKQLQYAFFQFKKGDLSKIIQQKATTENSKKLSLKLSAEQSKTKKNTAEEQKNKFSMRDFYV